MSARWGHLRARSSVSSEVSWGATTPGVHDTCHWSSTRVMRHSSRRSSRSATSRRPTRLKRSPSRGRALVVAHLGERHLRTQRAEVLVGRLDEGGRPGRRRALEGDRPRSPVARPAARARRGVLGLRRRLEERAARAQPADEHATDSAATVERVRRRGELYRVRRVPDMRTPYVPLLSAGAHRAVTSSVCRRPAQEPPPRSVHGWATPGPRGTSSAAAEWCGAGTTRQDAAAARPATRQADEDRERGSARDGDWRAAACDEDVAAGLCDVAQPVPGRPERGPEQHRDVGRRRSAPHAAPDRMSRATTQATARRAGRRPSAASAATGRDADEPPARVHEAGVGSRPSSPTISGADPGCRGPPRAAQRPERAAPGRPRRRAGPARAREACTTIATHDRRRARASRRGRSAGGLSRGTRRLDDHVGSGRQQADERRERAARFAGCHCGFAPRALSTAEAAPAAQSDDDRSSRLARDEGQRR